MATAAKDTALYIGWDVGGWNCDKNNKSRDALMISRIRYEWVSLYHE